MIALILFSYILFGDLFKIIPFISENRDHLTLTSQTYPTLSEAINYTISGYSIVLTALFSYFLLKSSVKSYEIAESIKSLENNRDRENIRQSALIVYYELLTGFSNMRDLYISVVLNDALPNPKRLFFSEDWVKNISFLKDELSDSEINEVYKIYNRFLTIKSILETESETYKIKLKSELEKEVDYAFASFIPKEIIATDLTSIEKILKRDYYLILLKVKIATFRSDEVKIEKNGEKNKIFIKDTVIYEGGILGNLFEGNGIIYTFEGFEKYIGFFSEGKFLSGVAKDYYGPNPKDILYEIEYSNNEKVKGYLVQTNTKKQFEYYLNGEFKGNEIFNGDTIIFKDNHKIEYIGKIKNSAFHGYGHYFNNGKIKYKGIFENDLIISGEEFGPNKFKFIGEFRFGKPHTGSVENYSDSYIKLFNGELKDGKPYQGRGYIFKEDYRGWDLDFIKHQEHFEEPDDDYLQQQLEWYEAQEEWHAEQENNHIRKSYREWEDFIKAEWKNGLYNEFENMESNKKVYYYKESKK